MVFLQGLRQPPGVSNDLIIQKPAYLSTLSPKKIWICFLLSLLCLNSLHTSADYIFVNLSFYLPNRCMLWWEILKHTLGAMMVISLAEADGLPPISPWNQWNARKWLAGELFHIVRSFGKRVLTHLRKHPSAAPETQVPQDLRKLERFLVTWGSQTLHRVIKINKQLEALGT